MGRSHAVADVCRMAQRLPRGGPRFEIVVMPVTTYALQDENAGILLAVWPTGATHRAATICHVPGDGSDGRAAQLAEALGDLSAALWGSYARPPSPEDALQEDEAAAGPGETMFAAVRKAITDPRLPDDDGSLLISYDAAIEAAHQVGRALHALGGSIAADAIAAEVKTEIDAVQRAGRGDFRGRAAQAVAVEALDASPLQISAADHLLDDNPLGDPRLWTDVMPAAACVAAVNWLVAAAVVAGEAANVDIDSVFAYADDIEAVSVQVPTFVVKARRGGLGPREVVAAMLAEAHEVRQGHVPAPARLPALVDAARAKVRKLPPGDREQALAAMLKRLTLLDPVRPSRDLLEHLLDGVRSCLLVYGEAAEDAEAELGEDLNYDEDDIDGRVGEAFFAAVRLRARAERAQLIR